jgi:hypothetical protein
MYLEVSGLACHPNAAFTAQAGLEQRSFTEEGLAIQANVEGLPIVEHLHPVRLLVGFGIGRAGQHILL